MGIPFNMAQAQLPKDDQPKIKLNVGRHLIRCIDIETKQTFTKGPGFFLRGAVVQGPSPEGQRVDIEIYPKSNSGGKGFSPEELEKRDLGKIQMAVAAVAGYPKTQAHVVSNEFMARACAFPRVEGGPISPFSGALYEIEAVPTVNLKGENTVFYEVYPYDASKWPTANPAPVSAAAPTAAPAPAPVPPPAPVAPASWLPAAWEAAGWKVHPGSPVHAFLGQDVKHRDQILGTA